MKALHRLILITVIAGLIPGCETSKPVTRRSELLGIKKLDRLVVFTRDSLVIRASSYWLLDSTLSLEGLLQRGDRWEPFKDTLRLVDIAYMQTTTSDGFKTVLAVVAAGFITYRALDPVFADGSGLTIVPQTRYIGPGSSGGGGSGNSCPFVYSWNGEHFELDGEAYAMAWGRQLEMTTSTLLRSVNTHDGAIRVRVTNERPETHYTNSISLRAASVDVGVEVVPDPRGTLWPVRRPEPPVYAVAGTGERILDAVVRSDGRMWESDLRNVSSGSDFVDRVELRFSKPRGLAQGTLVLHAINTDIFGIVLQNLADLLGEDFLSFVHALDHDTALVATLREWTEDASLKVDVWNGTTWMRTGTVLPEANVVDFSKAVRIETTDASDVRVRLSALSGVWRLDAIAIDWTPAGPLSTQELVAITALDGSGRDVRSALRRDDHSSVTVLPGGGIDLAFAHRDPDPGKRLACVLDVRGYLHEWMPPARPMAEFMGLIPGASRLSYAKTLLRSRGVLLPPLYAEWKAHRSRTAR